VDPLSAANFGFRGGLEMNLCNLNNAGGDYQTALQLEPDYISGIANLGCIYSMENKLEEAKKMLDKFEKLNQLFIGTENPIAYIYAKLGNKKKALDLSQDWNIFLALDMNEKGFAALLKNDKERDPLANDYILLKNRSQHKDFNFIRNDPRFLKIMESEKKEYEENKKKFSTAGILN
jgi:tetratricopeptide (TPR) repeat protein